MTNQFDERTTVDHPPVRRTLLGRTARFAALWAVLFVAILLFAAIEGIILWRAGFRYVAPTAVVNLGISDFSISPNGQLAASRIRYKQNSSAGAQEDVILFDLHGQNTGRLHLGHLNPQCVAISPNTDSVAVACTDGSIYAWSSAVHATRESAALSSRQFRPVSKDLIGQLVFSPDGQLLAGESHDFTYVWQWPTGKLVIKQLHSGPSRCISFSADSSRFLSRIASDEIVVWDLATGKPINAVSTGSLEVIGASLSPAGRIAAVAVDDGSLRVYDVQSGQELWQTRANLPAIAFSPDRKFLTSVWREEGENRHVINVRDVESGELICSLEGHNGPIVGLLFAADNTLYSWDTQGNLRAWDVNKQSEEWGFSTLQWASTGGVF